MDELLDVVDEQDNVIGQEMRSVCHEKMLLHRAVGVIAFKNEAKKEILFQVRAPGKNSAGKLCIPGGHLGAGQTYEEGASREFFEEMYNDHSGEKKLAFTSSFKILTEGDDDREINTLFLTIHDGEGKFTPDPKEVSGYRYISVQKLEEMVKEKSDQLTYYTILVFSEYFKKQ